MGTQTTHYRGTIPILSILRSTISTACHSAPVERVANYHVATSGTHVQFIAGNSYVSEMQL